jgi:hypothetical protein
MMPALLTWLSFLAVVFFPRIAFQEKYFYSYKRRLSCMHCWLEKGITLEFFTFLLSLKGKLNYLFPPPKWAPRPIGHLGENFGSLTAFTAVT